MEDRIEDLLVDFNRLSVDDKIEFLSEVMDILNEEEYGKFRGLLGDNVPRGQ